MTARTLSLLWVLAVAAGCDTDPIVGGEALSRGQAEAARAEFMASGVATYRLTYAIDCFCPPNEVTVRVVDGDVTEVETTGYDVEPLTVLGLYDVVLDAFQRDAAAVSATGLRLPAPRAGPDLDRLQRGHRRRRGGLPRALVRGPVAARVATLHPLHRCPSGDTRRSGRSWGGFSPTPCPASSSSP